MRTPFPLDEWNDDTRKRGQRSDVQNRFIPMTNHMPPIPPANRSNKGPKNEADPNPSADKKPEPQNSAEQGQTANIKQNTTNKGFFQGRRVK